MIHETTPPVPPNFLWTRPKYGHKYGFRLYLAKLPENFIVITTYLKIMLEHQESADVLTFLNLTLT